MNAKNAKRIGLTSIPGLALMPNIALAANMGDIASDLAGQGQQIGDLIMIICAVAGIGVALMGLFKFKAHSANPNDPSNKMSSALTLIFVGAAMVAIPELLGSGVSTIFGDGAEVQDYGRLPTGN
ncbi:DUF6750 family protein [Paracoccus litorisediminis]|uniref:DUF6750 family protein n=1 Tax=Paracoccus litorisediminis TaxID=2006130 RepID=UPI0037349CCA